jgi:spore maturation protein B
MSAILNFLSLYTVPIVVFVIPLYALIKKVPVYSSFVDGAKEGFDTAIMIIPYMVAMLCAIGMFRASGAMDWLVSALSPLTSMIGIPGEVLPMGIMRSFSGSGAQAMCAELLAQYGTTSQIGRIASVAMGSEETTFYVLAVYFGAVGITNSRQAVIAGLTADIASFVLAAIVVNLMWY